MFAKNELHNIAYSSFRFYNKKDHKFDNIAKAEHKALLELTDLDNLIISKADKGNVIVIIEKSSYFDKMHNILNDESKFVNVKFDTPNKELDYLHNQEKNNNFLKKSQ